MDIPVTQKIDIALAQRVSIRDAGLDEYWLQDQIYENPACLGLGELEVVQKEKQQKSGGKLDILLKDAEGESMYEVEIMLGETDETHIIRTIEYWDNEKRRWPQRQHYAVLVAEHINKRFFNVIHLLSYSIPIIAIQAALIESHDRRSVFFSKILDTYEEPDDGVSDGDGTFNRDYWAKRGPWILDAADELLHVIDVSDARLNYLKYYVAIDVSGYSYFRMHRRMQNKAFLGFRVSSTLEDDAASLLDSANISFKKRPPWFYVVTDKDMIGKHASTFRNITELVKKKSKKDS